MDTDLVLTLGIILLALSIPSLLAAWVEGRVPRVGAIMALASLGMVIAALASRPGGYVLEEVPGIMLSVLSRAIN
jgi:formate-dependent nitrite reductase membrane component NrfD